MATVYKLDFQTKNWFKSIFLQKFASQPIKVSGLDKKKD